MRPGVKSRTVKGLRRIRAYWGAQSDLERLAASHVGHVVNKWQHYYEIYDRHFSRYRGRDVTLLEIGVAGGGSLELWRRYFGASARIVGIDNDPACMRFESPGTRVVIGSQGDAEFLDRVAREMGPFDILIDDGSHDFGHQLTTYRALFPHIRDDGLYCCEDLCTSYWEEEYGGGVGKPGTHVEFLKGLLDEQNAWFWQGREEPAAGSVARTVHGIHFYPALVIMEKRPMTAPLLTPVGAQK